MNFCQIKMKIDKVMMSCENNFQRWNGFKYCEMLINKYLFDWDNQDMQDYLIKYMRRCD